MRGQCCVEFSHDLLLLLREIFLFSEYVLQLGVVRPVVVGELRGQRGGLTLPKVNLFGQTVQLKIGKEGKDRWGKESL